MIQTHVKRELTSNVKEDGFAQDPLGVSLFSDPAPVQYDPTKFVGDAIQQLDGGKLTASQQAEAFDNLALAFRDMKKVDPAQAADLYPMFLQMFVRQAFPSADVRIAASRAAESFMEAMNREPPLPARGPESSQMERLRVEVQSARSYQADDRLPSGRIIAQINSGDVPLPNLSIVEELVAK